MKKRLAEETILFISVVKWIVLASLIGVIVGLSTTAFLKALSWSTGFGQRFPFYFLVLPAALFLSALLTKYLAPEARGHGTEKVIEAVHKRSGRINAAVVPVKLLATVITLASGGSAGKEGPCAQIGAGLSSIFADIFKFNDTDRKKLVICGISAGFAAVFGTPIAGAIFGVEVLFVGSILYDVLLPSFVAGIMAYQVSSALGMTYVYQALPLDGAFREAFFLKVVVAGMFFGFCALLLVEALRLGGKIARGMKIWEPWKGAFGGTLLVLLTLVFSREYLGLGLDKIQLCLQGSPAQWQDFLLKIVFTAITLSFGGSGGIVTPIFFIGATAGSLFGQALGLDLRIFSAIGLAGLLAGAANTPIAASILAIELFGPQIAPYAAVASVVSFLISGHRSVYPSQILATRKSESVQVDMGKEMDALSVHVEPRKQSLASGLLKLAHALAERFRRAKS